jgi:Cu2+-exporting ATPase
VESKTAAYPPGFDLPIQVGETLRDAMRQTTTPQDGSRCRHCRNPVPAGASTAPFCCRGCEAVHALLLERGLERFYDLQGDATGAPPPRPEAAAPPHGWLEPLLERAESGAGGDFATLTLDVQGIHCAACVWLMQETFRSRPGAGAITVNPAIGRVDLAWRRGHFDPEAWLRDVEAFGYRFGPARKQASRASVDLPLRLGISTALTLNLMIFSVSFYFGLAPADGELFRLFSWLSLGLATAVAAIGGWPFFRAAVAGLRRGVVHLDLPIAVGILLVWASSLASMRDGRGDLAYFDTLGVFITLMLAGRFLQERLIERNRRFLLADEGADDLVVRRVEGERVVAVAAPHVRAGDLLLVAPGELVPVDGRLVSAAAAALSTDWIDGESEPHAVEPGEAVAAGSFNAGDGAIEVLAATDFADSPLVSLLTRTPRRAEHERLGGRIWDRLGRAWVVAVLTVATLGVVLWLPIAGPGRAIEVAAALLVVTCPCAIGIALPLARELTLHRLRRAGCYVRSDDLLERLPKVGKLLFDKTGTLTLGRLELAEPRAVAALDPAARDVAYDLASRSGHPAARAIAQALEAAGARFDPAASPREVRGEGLELERDGARWRLGRAAWAAPACGGEGTVLARGGERIADLALVEVARPDAAAELARLAGRGFEIWLLSGDSPARVARLAAAVGVPAARALGGLLPEQKAELVGRIDAGDTLYLGDGVNDALAFSRALAAGTPAIDRPVMPGRSDFFLVGEGLAPLAAALDHAAALARVTRRLLAAAIVYNVAAVAAALAGQVTPLAAAVVMPTSTLFLIGLTVWSLAPGRSAAVASVPMTLAEARP